VVVPPPVAAENAAPTILACERAMARSPEEMEAVLDRFAAMAPTSGSEPDRIGAFTRSDSAIHALVGEY
jgi:hypothetical protein